MQTRRDNGTVDSVGGFILLVEDNEDDIVLTRRALAKLSTSLELVVVRDGLAALDFCFGSTARGWEGPALMAAPLLVLLDLRIPKASGLEVYASLRTQELTKEAPIAILSASREEMRLLEDRGLGADAYIDKPLSADRLGELLARFGVAAY